MEREKIALGALVIIIVAVLSFYLLSTEGVFDNILGDSKDGVVNKGDCVDVHYTGKFQVNGTVFDTSYESVAKENGIYNELRTYQPLKVFVDTTDELSPPSDYQNYTTGMISGFIEGLVGMKEGETKTVTIPPEDAYGTWNVSLAQSYLPNIPLETEVAYSWTETKSNFSLYFSNVNITEGNTFDYGNLTFQQEGIINATITNVTNKTLTYVLEPNNGTKFTMPVYDVESTIVVDENDSENFVIYAGFEEGHTFTITYFQTFHFKVVSVNETHAEFAINTQAPEISFVDQTLVFELTAVNVYDTAELDEES